MQLQMHCMLYTPTVKGLTFLVMHLMVKVNIFLCHKTFLCILFSSDFVPEFPGVSDVSDAPRLSVPDLHTSSTNATNKH